MLSLDFLLASSTERLVGFFRSVPDQIAGIGFRDILDILYLSVILFFVISFLRERRAGGLIIGVGLWSAVYGLSCILDLHAVRTVLGAVFAVGVLALVVIFQPEIRDMLQRMGLDSYRNIRSSIASEKQSKQAIQDESIDAICQAASELSRLRTGALIVFERSDQIGDVIRSGIEVDAKISPYLLRNIFFDKSPLHDGAVVIRDRRICAAGCLLPLSRRSNLDPSLGTRHRAGIGLSESSDAVIVIVSEETGIISVAFRREISRNLSYSTLKAFLYKVMLNQSDEEGENKKKEEKSEHES